MSTSEIQPLVDNYHRKIARVTLDFKRYLYHKINWNARMIGIKGARGVGKTTMLLQHILDNYQDIDQTLYASLDDFWFSTHSLLDLVDWAYQHGMKRLYLDEVHRYRLWSETLKNIYDNYPDMSIVFTSSSLLAMDNATVDLSRRQTLYMLHGLSFREFLAFENVAQIAPLPLEMLLSDHVKHAMQITKSIKIHPLFEVYLKRGYYPFYREVDEDFPIHIREIVSLVIESDLAAVENVSFDTILKVKKLLMIICENVPFSPNMSALWKQLSTNNELGLRMLYALDRAQILSLLTARSKSYKYLYKPDKIYINNTNLMHSLCANVDTDNERETFFLSQMSVVHDVKKPLQSDFFIDNKYLFEVGGKNKTFVQIKDKPNSFLAIDETEVGHGNRIPLWMFGLIY